MKKVNVNKKTIGIVLVLGVMLLVLTACGKTNNFENSFKIKDYKFTTNEANNFVEVNYEIENTSKDELSFSISIDGQKEKHVISPKDKKENKIIISVDKPDEYVMNFNAIYEVEQNGKSIWKKEEKLTHDFTNDFKHTAVVKYKDVTKNIELEDYKKNTFKINELFPEFDGAKKHSVSVKNGSNDIINICVEDNDEDKGKKQCATGNILRCVTWGKEKICDTYQFSDNLEIEITDAVEAKDVNWSENLKPLKDSKYETSRIAGTTITTFEMDVEVNNISDEDIKGSVTEFYVNDKMVSNEYLAASKNSNISAHEKGKVYNISGASVWLTTGEKNVKKFGLRVVLVDSNNNEIYNDIQWIVLD